MDHSYSVEVRRGAVCISENEPSPSYLERFDDIIKEFMTEQSIPGASLCLSLHGKVVYSQGYGAAGTGRPALSMSMFRIASISKPITALVTMKLWQDGKLNLQQTVFGPKGILKRYKPNSKGDKRLLHITSEHLLQHSAGWDRDQAGDPVFWNLEKVSKDLDPHSKEALVQYMMSKKLQFSPGRRHSYSNLGYLILGMVIEEVSGMSYIDCVYRFLGDAATDKIFVGHAKKLQCDYMEVEYYNNRDELLAPSIFPGEGLVASQYGSFPMEDTGAYGGLVTAAPHLLALFDSLFAPSCEIIQANTYAKMIQRPRYASDSVKEWYGLGLDVQDDGSSWGHTGAMEGTSTTFCHHKSGFSWVLLLNSWSRDMDLDGLIKYALSRVSVWPLWEPCTNEGECGNSHKVVSKDKTEVVYLLIHYDKFITHVEDMKNRGFWVTSVSICVVDSRIFYSVVFKINKKKIQWKYEQCLHNDEGIEKMVANYTHKGWKLIILDTCLHCEAVVHFFLFIKTTVNFQQIVSLHLPAKEHLDKMEALKSENYKLMIQSVTNVNNEMYVGAVFERSNDECRIYKTVSWLQISPEDFVYELGRQAKQNLGVEHLKFFTDGDYPSVSVVLSSERTSLCLQRHHASKFGFLYELIQSAKENIPLQFLCTYYNEGVLNFAAVWEAVNS